MNTLRIICVILAAISVCQFARSQAQSGIQILQATYGADSAQIDVTEKIKSLVQSGQTNIQVGNHLFGKDPVFGKSKTLSVSFVQGGVQYQTTAREGELLSFAKADVDQSNVAPQTTPAPAPAKHPQLAGQTEAQTLSPETAMWLVERIAVRTKGGITGIPPGTKVTLIEDHGEKLLVSDGSLKFEATRAQITTDVAVAQSASDNAAQSAVISAWNAQVVQQQQATAKAQQRARAGSNGQDLSSLLFRALTHTTRPDDAALAASLANSPETQKIREGTAAMEAHAPRSFSPPSPPRPLPNSAGDPNGLGRIALDRLKRAARQPSEETRRKTEAQQRYLQSQH